VVDQQARKVPPLMRFARPRGGAGPALKVKSKDIPLFRASPEVQDKPLLQKVEAIYHATRMKLNITQSLTMEEKIDILFNKLGGLDSSSDIVTNTTPPRHKKLPP
jgi:hypothetical protein